MSTHDLTRDPDLIHVTEHGWTELPARAAFVHLTLRADRLFSGRAALTKAEELRRLAAALVARDIPEDAIALEGASLDVSTGLFTRSSSVTYRVRVHLRDLDRLADALDAITAAKQASVTHITWDWGDETAGADLLAACATRAAARARVLAGALDVTLAGVHAVHEEAMEETPPVAEVEPFGVVRAMKTRQSSIASELGGLDLAPARRVGVRVRISYRVR